MKVDLPTVPPNSTHLIMGKEDGLSPEAAKLGKRTSTKVRTRWKTGGIGAIHGRIPSQQET